MADKYNQKWVEKLSQTDMAVDWPCSGWAITLGQTTYYSVLEEDVDVGWRRHEEKHKEQWRREGRIKFAVKYLYYHFTRGYWQNPYEIEADG